ncbi:SAVED domain-containing protein [Spirulina major]|uniref:SAVED domain-containing protein n=1 Tax=Spirulina major TaxID=270636 RepID=UPI0009323708|nr:SAVED domain-containing protein [Spirulina major]
MLRKVNRLSSTIRVHWRPIILENPGALLAAIAAIPSAFLADYVASYAGLKTLAIAGYEFYLDSYLVAFIFITLVYSIGVFVETRKFIFYNQRAISLPTIINIGNKADSQDALKILVQALAERLNLSQNYLYELERYLTIASEDLIFNYPIDINNPSELYDTLAVIRHNLTRLQRQTPREHILELVYIGPIAIAVWLGAVTHTESIALWPHSSDTENSYPHRIAVPHDLQMLSLPEQPKKTQSNLADLKIAPETSKGKTWLVALDLSYQPRLANHDSFFADIDHCLYIRGVKDSVTITDHEYIDYAHEIYQHIVQLDTIYAPHSIRLVLRMPNVLAIMLGRSLKTLLPVEVAHYDSTSRSYSVLFKLNDARFRYRHIT